jgi:hypothetical protein
MKILLLGILKPVIEPVVLGLIESVRRKIVNQFHISSIRTDMERIRNVQYITRNFTASINV